VVHGWFPYLAAGSERMIQHMIDALPEDEFDVHVLSFGVGPDVIYEEEYEYDGIPVTVGFEPPIVPDLILTHHGPGARVSQQLAQEFPDAATVAVFHNERYDIPDIIGFNADLNVYNTHWVKDAIQLPGIVVHPPLEYDRHHVAKTGPCVTLVNLQKNKGVDTFYALAGRMDIPFLGVVGTHGEQETDRFRDDYNVQILNTTQDMREVWRKTRVVLMPSGYESYGMVAAEACVSGIPVIAHPTPGLTECLGSAGIFIDRDDTDKYEQALRLLLTDDNHYQERSDLARLRARELVCQSQQELSTFVDNIRELVG
jgi:glycosyltransferase involved in cell wall biosynthesis